MPQFNQTRRLRQLIDFIQRTIYSQGIVEDEGVYMKSPESNETQEIYEIEAKIGLIQDIAMHVDRFSPEYLSGLRSVFNGQPIEAPPGLAIVVGPLPDKGTLMVGVRQETGGYVAQTHTPSQRIAGSEYIRKFGDQTPVFIGQSLELSEEDSLLFVYSPDRSMRAFFAPDLDQAHLMGLADINDNLEVY